MEQRRDLIVVGVDGSSGSRAALAYALRDGARRGAAVEVVAAFAPPEYWVPLYGPPAISPEEVREGVRRDAERTVREVGDEVRGEDVPQLPDVTVTAVADGAAHALLHAARHADLLVVGSRGHGALAGMLLGSVGLACAIHAPCPVTVVRGADEPQHDPTEEKATGSATG